MNAILWRSRSEGRFPHWAADGTRADSIANRAIAAPLSKSIARFGAGAPPIVVAGAVALGAAVGSLILLPPNLGTVVLAGAATLALATSPRLGPLGAALLVALVLPWGRGADTFTVDLAGVPIRPHDAALGLGVIAALPLVRRPFDRRRLSQPTSVLLAAFAVLGAIGVGVGLLLDHPLRDVFRDVRWWLFYAAGLIAVIGGATRPQLLRAFLIGATVFAFVVVVTAMLPTFPGGVKHQELLYDRGTMRMQFGNSAFLLPAIAWVATLASRRLTATTVAWLLLLLVAVVLSLTRTSILVTAGMLALVIIALALRNRREDPRRVVRSAAAIVATAAVALVVGIGLSIAATPPADEIPTSGGQTGEGAIDRILFQDDRSDISSLDVGRFPSYRIAAAHIRERPVTGGGLGQLTEVDYAYDKARAYTVGKLPGVDNAYLTVGLKTGLPGMLVFGLLMLTPLLALLRGAVRRHAAWFGVGWLGLLVLSMTQSYATSLYGPFGVAMLLVVPVIAGRRLTRPVLRRPARFSSAS